MNSVQNIILAQQVATNALDYAKKHFPEHKTFIEYLAYNHELVSSLKTGVEGMNDFEAYKKYLTSAKKIKLSQNFSLREMIYSDVAIAKKIDNRIFNPTINRNLSNLCLKVLQPVRNHFKKPVDVSSGYRSPELNKAVGGVLKSQHVEGKAADISITGVPVKDIYEYIKNNLEYDQLINEYDKWVHVSWNNLGNRKEAFKK
jgi:hypothetical protein